MSRARRATWRMRHPQPYRRGNSPESIAAAAEAGDPTDVDVQQTREGRLVGAHWPVPAKDQMRYTAASTEHGVPARKVGKLVRRPLRTLPLDLVLTLRSRDGYRYHRLSSLVEHAGTIGAQLELEFKFTPTEVQLRRLRTVAEKAYGTDRWDDMTWIKRLARIGRRPVPRWRTVIARARTVGFRTIAIRCSEAAATRAGATYFRP